jgi:hypothetical protein
MLHGLRRGREARRRRDADETPEEDVMAMRIVVDSLDDVPEAHKAQVEQLEDGKVAFELDALPDTSRLERTVEALRKERDGAAKQLREVNQRIEQDGQQLEQLGGWDKIRELLEERERVKEEEARQHGKIEDLYKGQLEAEQKKARTEIEKRDAAIKELTEAMANLTREVDIAKAMEVAKPLDWLRTHTQLWLEKQAITRKDEDGRWRTYARMDDGELDLVEYAEKWVKTPEGQQFTRGMEAEGGGASTVNGARVVSDPFKSGNRTQQAQLFRENPQRYEKLKAEHDARRHQGVPARART